MTPAEWAFFQKHGGDACTQGMSIFTPGCTMLARGGGYGPGAVKDMLKEALRKFESQNEHALVAPLSAEEQKLVRRPPEGGCVVYVTWKVLGSFGTARVSSDLKHDEAFRGALGVD